jgi:hypothetical protein
MKNDARVLFLEVNEADRHFLERLVRRGRLPAFARAIDEGVLLNTRVPGWDAKRDRAWRDISPWIVWPSVYTGLLPAEHGIIGFGQDTSALRDRCLWDVLDKSGVSTGVFGSLMSYPPRNHGACAFYVPEALADTPDCFPDEARPVQEFNVLAARNYSEGFGWKGVTAFAKLLRSVSVGVRPSTVARAVWQVPAEKIRGAHQEPERAMLASYIGAEAFRQLYRSHQPRFATVHMNHVAYMQHRYWRAAEPDRFADELSETDRRFFGTVSERRAYEAKFANWIDRSFEYTDELLGQFMDEVPDGTWILFGTALGQRPLDPCGEIHNPVVRLVRERELFGAIGLPTYRVQHQMNPDVTVDLDDEASAREAERLVRGLHVHEGEPLFEVQRRGRQLFLELNVPRRREGSSWPPIRHSERPGWTTPAERHVAEHWNNDQSTAHHKDVGLFIAWRKGSRVTSEVASIDVTDIAPNILRIFGLPPAPWHRPRNPNAFTVTP